MVQTICHQIIIHFLFNLLISQLIVSAVQLHQALATPSIVEEKDKLIVLKVGCGVFAAMERYFPLFLACLHAHAYRKHVPVNGFTRVVCIITLVNAFILFMMTF